MRIMIDFITSDDQELTENPRIIGISFQRAAAHFHL